MRPLLLQGTAARLGHLGGPVPHLRLPDRRLLSARGVLHRPAALRVVPEDAPRLRIPLGGVRGGREAADRRCASTWTQRPATSRCSCGCTCSVPHEPYEAHPEFDFGDRDVDRYDWEIAAADRTLGELVKAMRAPQRRVGRDRHGRSRRGVRRTRRPLSRHDGVRRAGAGAAGDRRRRSDRAEPGARARSRPSTCCRLCSSSARRAAAAAHARARSVGAARRASKRRALGFALAETDEQTLLAEGTMPADLRAARGRLPACTISSPTPVRPRTRLRTRLATSSVCATRCARSRPPTAATRSRGLRAEGKGWPPALVRGIAGDARRRRGSRGSARTTWIRSIRRKAAQVLFDLSRSRSAPSLRLALSRDEDPEVRRYAALALTRLGEGRRSRSSCSATPTRTCAGWPRCRSARAATSGPKPSSSPGGATASTWSSRARWRSSARWPRFDRATRSRSY